MSIRFGVNYLPRRNWWYEWGEDGTAAWDDDLGRLAELGFDHIRVQCLWPVFQPNPDWVSPRALRRLGQLLDIADAHGLAVCVTILDGWLSGFDFRPAWLKSLPAYTDREAIRAAAFLVRAVAESVAGHPALWCIDIANEPNVLMGGLRRGEGEAWARTMLAEARRAGAPVTVGADHDPWMNDAAPLSREFLVQNSDLVAVHAWPYFTGALAAVGEEKAWAIPDYLAQIARGTPGADGKPLWIQELGVSELWLDRIEVSDFAEAMLRRSAAVPGVAAISWWASHDIPRRFTGFDELEYGLGLIDEEGRLKPVGARIVDVIAQLRRMSEPVSDPSAERPEPSQQTLAPEGGRTGIAFAAQWFEQMDAVAGPRIAAAPISATEGVGR
ncbi:glycoside hydrolase 5 family protein [Leifsonia sp. 21MFCrub1.1]|uniref:glycoside hydrolase 5 family protein n=1 Tax=Leifsonia sp. 21MFCrub1.1 TaxID=1798223 RepID=UPI00089287EF|nr:cellulase family glycosylhydrolase [Leifsonia sp. 21MFCrub1.1]SEB09928.1 Cellulase (glycosyl hydrolase family 5) [Leifsonia sp. 21MFCrub1.1]